ncbi:MAG: phage portal protein [Rhizobiaceae bacterium]|nr:phage portal protein [Rhizobiaceae bacterium]
MADGVAGETIRKGEAVPLRFRQWYIPDRDKAQAWREEAKEDFDFVASRQYSEDEEKTLIKRKRPVVVFNRIGPIIDAITGYEIGNRREVRYIPREMGDVKPNELLTGAGQWFRDEGYGSYADSAMFASAVICGMGWTETRLNLSDGPNPKPVIEEIDPFEMVWDRDARQRNLKDARRVWRVRRLPTAEAKAMFPGFDKNELHAGWTEVNSEADLKRAHEPTGEPDDGYVTIVQCQWIEKEEYYLAEDPTTGQEAEFTPEEYSQANKRLKMLIGMEMQGVKFKRKVRKQAFFGEVVLSYGPAPCNDEFSLQCVTAKFDRNKGTWYGVVRAMKDPQRWANKWLAQMMHIMNSNAKGGIMAEKGAFADPRTAQREWSQPDSVTIMADGAISGQKVKEKPQGQFPIGFQQLTEFAISSIRDVSGVSVELLGMREADQAASLEMQRRQAGMTILQPLFDGLKLYREMQGRVVLYYLQNDIPDGTLIRISGKDQEQYVPLMKEADKAFDIIVDDAPESPNQKEQIWDIVSSMLPLVGKVIPPEYILKALKYSPLPSSVVSELEEMAKAPNPEAQQAAAARAQMAAAEIDKTKSEAVLNKAKAMSEGAKGETEQIKAQAERESAEMEMQVSRQEFVQSMQQMAMERERDREKHAADMQKIAAQVEAMNAKATAQRQAVRQ